MATTSLWHIEGRLKDLIDYVENPEKTAAKAPELQDLYNVFSYVQRPEATQEGEYVTALNCLKETALQQMILTKKRYGKTDGYCDRRKCVGDQWLRWNKDIAGNTFFYSELIVKVTPKYADNNSHGIKVTLENNRNYWLAENVLQNDVLGIMYFKIIISEGLGLVRGEWTKNPNHNGGSYATVNLWVAYNSEFFIPVPTSVQIALRDSPLAGTHIQVYVR